MPATWAARMYGWPRRTASSSFLMRGVVRFVGAAMVSFTSCPLGYRTTTAAQVHEYPGRDAAIEHHRAAFHDDPHHRRSHHKRQEAVICRPKQIERCPCDCCALTHRRSFLSLKSLLPLRRGMLRQVRRDGALFQVFIHAVAFGADVALQRLPELRVAGHKVAVNESITTALWAHEAGPVTDMADVRRAGTIGVAIPAGDAARCGHFPRLGVGDADKHATGATTMPEAARALDADTFRRECRRQRVAVPGRRSFVVAYRAHFRFPRHRRCVRPLGLGLKEAKTNRERENLARARASLSLFL